MSGRVQAVDWEAGLSSAWESVADIVPKIVIFLVILGIGWFIAKAVSKLVGKLLERVGFNRILERSGLNNFFSPTFGPSELITKLLYYGILLLALQLSLSVFGPNAISDIVNDIVAWLPKLIVAVVIIVIVAAIAKAVKDVLTDVLGGLSYGGTLAKIVSVAIIALGVIAALNQVGIGTTVTMPVLVTVLATVGGILVVGVGGGLIQPMRQRWDGWLGQLEQDTAAAKDHQQQRAAAPAEYADQGGYDTQGGYADEGASAEQGSYSDQGTYHTQGYPQGGTDPGYPPR
ncbi:MAG: mechanosensitive ion channel family protein [Nocardioidaceae bacterium]